MKPLVPTYFYLIVTQIYKKMYIHKWWKVMNVANIFVMGVFLMVVKR